MAIGTIGFYAGYSALLAQLSPLLTDAGYDATTVGAAMGTVAFAAFAGVLLFGVIAEVTRTQVTGTGFLIATAGLAQVAVLLTHAAGPAALYGLTAAVGVLIGGGDTAFVEALRRAAGLQGYKMAYGWWYLLVLATLAAASLATGAAFDLLGNYRTAFHGISALALLAAIVWVLPVRFDPDPRGAKAPQPVPPA